MGPLPSKEGISHDKPRVWGCGTQVYFNFPTFRTEESSNDDRAMNATLLGDRLENRGNRMILVIYMVGKPLLSSGLQGGCEGEEGVFSEILTGDE